MTPDEWHDGIRNEAASVSDTAWANAARQSLTAAQVRLNAALLLATLTAGAVEIAWNGTALFTGELLGAATTPLAWFESVPWLILVVTALFGTLGVKPRQAFITGLITLPAGFLLYAAYVLMTFHHVRDALPLPTHAILLAGWMAAGSAAGQRLRPFIRSTPARRTV